MMDSRTTEFAHKKNDLPTPPCDPVSLVGSCYGFAVVRASEVNDFYRGYAVIVIAVTVIAIVVGIAYLAIGMLF